MRPSAWNEIAIPTVSGDEKIRRADSKHPFDFFRGRDVEGNHLFLFRSATSKKNHKLPSLVGIKITHEPFDGVIWQLKLTLLEQSHADIFGVLCANLMEATRGLRACEQAEVLDVILKRLVRWQNLLKAARPTLLNPRAQMGLFGELIFIRDVLIPQFGVSASIRGWRGPYGDEQDFSVGGKLIEIKSLRDTSDRKINISSAAQLDMTSGEIYIVIQIVNEIEKEDHGVSLLELAEQIIGIAYIEGPAVGDTFRAALDEMGFESRIEYAEPLRGVTQRQFLKVSQDFPRLIPSDLPVGMSEVKYVLDVSLLSLFEVDGAVIWREL